MSKILSIPSHLQRKQELSNFKAVLQEKLDEARIIAKKAVLLMTRYASNVTLKISNIYE
jgi:hypothetical protein